MFLSEWLNKQITGGSEQPRLPILCDLLLLPPQGGIFPQVGLTRKPKVNTFTDISLLNSKLTQRRHKKCFPFKGCLSLLWAPLRTPLPTTRNAQHSTCFAGFREAGQRKTTIVVSPTLQTPGTARITNWLRGHICPSAAETEVIWFVSWITSQWLLEDCLHSAPESVWTTLSNSLINKWNHDGGGGGVCQSLMYPSPFYLNLFLCISSRWQLSILSLILSPLCFSMYMHDSRLILC